MYKLIEKMIYHRIKEKIELVLPPEFAGFRYKRSCSEQVLALTTHIETGFEKELKTAMALILFGGSVFYGSSTKLYRVEKLAG